MACADIFQELFSKRTIYPHEASSPSANQQQQQMNEATILCTQTHFISIRQFQDNSLFRIFLHSFIRIEIQWN